MNHGHAHQHPLSHVAGQGHAAGAGMVPGRGMMRVQPQCHFPSAPPRRVYCNPAPFSAGCGEGYFKLLSAYGQSRPCYSNQC